MKKKVTDNKYNIYQIINLKLLIYDMLLLQLLRSWEILVIRSYPGKSMIVSEFESSRGTTRINHRWTQNKTEMEDATI